MAPAPARSFAMMLVLMAGCLGAPQETASAFTIVATPSTVQDAVPGQLLVFMVTIESQDAAPVALTATIGGRPVTVTPGTLAPGEVAEIGSEIAATDAGSTLLLEVRGERDERVEVATANVSVAPDPGEPPLKAATEVRDMFVRWLASEHPELGIDESTAWDATVARPIWLVVSYYTFYTDEWEMGVRWHIMIPPHDWAEIYLRERYEETAPSLAWKIDSRSASDQEPYGVTPEPEVWR